jgi:hypothetical protein
MTLVDILGIEKIFSGKIDLEKKTFELKFLGFSIKGIKYSWIKELMKDNLNSEKLLSEMFIRKQVMWQDFGRENVELCLKSLEDLKVQCDKAMQDFIATKKSKDKFYASMLRHWADNCDIAIKELLTAKEREQILKGEFEQKNFMPAYQEIPRILGTFRAKTLPTIKELSKLLPETNPIRKDTEDKINLATNDIIKNYGINSGQIQDGQYELLS